MLIAYIHKYVNSRHLPKRKDRISARAGQSIVESCLVICLICVLFMWMLQVSEMIAAREVLSYAAACSARSQTVGFNRFMIWKTGHVASIPNAGIMTAPQYVNTDTYLGTLRARYRKSGNLFSEVVAHNSPQSGQYAVERGAIPEFMSSENEGRARYILDYANWENVHADPDANELIDGSTAKVTASQVFSNYFPFHRAFYAGDEIHMHASAEMESHYPLYLNYNATYW